MAVLAVEEEEERKSNSAFKVYQLSLNSIKTFSGFSRNSKRANFLFGSGVTFE